MKRKIEEDQNFSRIWETFYKTDKSTRLDMLAYYCRTKSITSIKTVSLDLLVIFLNLQFFVSSNVGTEIMVLSLVCLVGFSGQKK